MFDRSLGIEILFTPYPLWSLNRIKTDLERAISALFGSVGLLSDLVGVRNGDPPKSTSKMGKSTKKEGNQLKGYLSIASGRVDSR